MPNNKSTPEPETAAQQETGGGCQQEPCCASFADLPFEEQVSRIAVELRVMVWDDANDMMQGAMAGCPMECLAFAKWWIQRAKGLPTDVPGDYPVFRHNAGSMARELAAQDSDNSTNVNG